MIPCYPITQQIAEKVHAYTRHHISGESSRVKDLIDILLLAELTRIEADHLSRAIQATFDARNTHSLPREMPDPPSGWSKPFQKMAAEVYLTYETLEDANQAIKRLLNPLLSGKKILLWNPELWSWS